MILGAGAIVSFLSGDANADNFNVTCQYINPLTGKTVIKYVQSSQETGATEGYDPTHDATFTNGSSPTVDFFIRNSTGDYKKDARDPNSTSDFYARIEGRGFNGPANLEFTIDRDEGNFDWKNLIVELYNDGDVNDPNNKMGVYDGHDLVNGSVSFPTLTITNGLSYQILTKPRHCADLTLNQKIDANDLSKIKQNWLRVDCNAANQWCDYANIT